MKNGKIGYAVVGLGIGKAHVDAAAASNKCELVAVCDLIQAKLDKIVERYPGTLTYLDFDEMLKIPRSTSSASVCRARCTLNSRSELWKPARTCSSKSR